jgi:hypothetical protein
VKIIFLYVFKNNWLVRIDPERLEGVGIKSNAYARLCKMRSKRAGKGSVAVMQRKTTLFAG